jgi:hypothetical protein
LTSVSIKNILLKEAPLSLFNSNTDFSESVNHIPLYIQDKGEKLFSYMEHGYEKR